MRDPTQKPAPPANSANRAARVVACPAPPLSLQVLLDEARIEVNVELHQRRITNRLEAMNLTGLDDKDISRAALEGLAVDGPHSPAFADELDLVIRVPMRASRGRGTPKHPCRPARIQQTHANYQQMADSLGARDASFTALLPGLDESCHHLVTRHFL